MLLLNKTLLIGSTYIYNEDTVTLMHIRLITIAWSAIKLTIADAYGADFYHCWFVDNFYGAYIYS